LGVDPVDRTVVAHAVGTRRPYMVTDNGLYSLDVPRFVYYYTLPVVALVFAVLEIVI